MGNTSLTFDIMKKSHLHKIYISGGIVLTGIAINKIVNIYRLKQKRLSLSTMKSAGFTNWNGGNTYLSKMPKGIRNNNPGNLNKTAIRWQGKLPKPNNGGRFEMFKSPEYGVRAMIKDLTTKIKRHSTIKAIIGEYAPVFENNTQAYINSVSKAMRVSENAPLVVSKNNLKHLVISMSKHENGGNYISDELFEKAYRII